MNYEQAIADSGGFGRYQITLTFLIAITSFKGGFNLQNLVFQPYAVNFQCSTTIVKPELNRTFDNSCYTNISGTYTACTSFDYETSVLQRTLVTEYDLVCGRAWLISLYQSFALAGSTVGLLAASLGDKIGRKKIIVAFAVMDILTGWTTILMPSIEYQIIARFIVNLSDNFYVMNYILLSELVPSSHRPVTTCIYGLFWCAGYSTCSGVAKLLSDWRWIQLATLIPITTYPYLLYIVPESPRWLSLKNRHGEALLVYKKIAKFNGVIFKEKMYENYNVNTKDKTNSEFLSSFKSSTMRRKVCILIFLSWVIYLVYYGLSLDAKLATDDIFLNSLLTGLIEMPSYLMCWKMFNIFGRKKPMIFGIFGVGIAVLLIPFLPEKGSLLAIRMVVAVSGKFLITFCFSGAYTYITEMLPTSVRSTFFVMRCIVGGLATIVSPFIISLSKGKQYYLGGLIFGGQSLLSGLLLLLLPDTHNCPMSQTVEEADKLRRGQEHLVRLHENETSPLLRQKNSDHRNFETSI